ncbi:ISSfl2 ORF [Shigella sonnei]|nr:ISSfl2 ORF [Shigella sonnei]
MVTLKAHILPHPDLQPPGCRGSGKRLFDKALPNDENKLRSLISDLKQHGQILLVVDQPATIGALPVAVARSEGVLVGYLPGLAMRRIADLHAGEAKTDARDAAIIAEAARTLPHAIAGEDRVPPGAQVSDRERAPVPEMVTLSPFLTGISRHSTVCLLNCMKGCLMLWMTRNW